MAGHRWQKGEVTNPRGRPRLGTALAETIRELANPVEMFEIAMSIARGNPMVRIVDRKTGKPRLATVPSRGNLSHAPGEARAIPIDCLSAEDQDAVISDISWPSVDDRMKALTWLATFGGMKPPAEVIMDVNRTEGQAEIDFSKWTPEELNAYVTLMEKASAPEQKAPVLELDTPPDRVIIK